MLKAQAAPLSATKPSTRQHQASSARKVPTRATDDQATDHERIRTRSRSTSQTYFYPATGPGAPRPRSPSASAHPVVGSARNVAVWCAARRRGGRGQQRRGLADRGSQQQQQPARTCVQWVRGASAEYRAAVPSGRGARHTVPRLVARRRCGPGAMRRVHGQTARSGAQRGHISAVGLWPLRIAYVPETPPLAPVEEMRQSPPAWHRREACKDLIR